MKRFHVHMRVEDLQASVKLYGVLFGAEPSVRKADYAKWMLDDPRINFAISAGSGVSAIDHLGFEVDPAARPPRPRRALVAPRPRRSKQSKVLSHD